MYYKYDLHLLSTSNISKQLESNSMQYEQTLSFTLAIQFGIN